MSDYICKRKDEGYTFKADSDTCEFSLPSWEPIKEIVYCYECKAFISSGYCGEMHHKALANGFCNWAVRNK